MTFDAARAAMLRRKVAWRIMPLVILLYLVAYLDRANVGFAKLRMARDLQFSDEVFGLGIGIFFLGYLTLEIPGAPPANEGARVSGSRGFSSPGAWSRPARRWCARRCSSTWCGFCSASPKLVSFPASSSISRTGFRCASAQWPCLA